MARMNITLIRKRMCYVSGKVSKMTVAIITPANIKSVNECLNTRDVALIDLFDLCISIWGQLYSFLYKWLSPSWLHFYLWSYYQSRPPEENHMVTQDLVFLLPQCQLQR